MRYTRIPNDIIRSNLLNAFDFRIWCFIASTDTGNPFTTQMACEALGINDKTWRKSVRKLEALGMIKTTLEKGGKVGYNPVLSPTEWSEEPLPRDGNPCHEMVTLTTKRQPLPRNGNPPCHETATPPYHETATLTTKRQPPLEYILNNNILDNNNINNNILENIILEKEKEEEKEKETDEQQLVKNIVSGQWAEAMMKNHNLSIASLQWLINEAIAYLHTSDEPITETTVKRATMNSASIHKNEIRERERIASLKAVPVSQRMEEFRRRLAQHVDKEGRDKCNRFYRCWTETDDEGVMRFERCRTFDIARRLANFK